MLRYSSHAKNKQLGQPQTGVHEGCRVNIPTGIVYSPREARYFKPPKSVLARNFNLVRFTQLAKGGHFAFWEQPAAMTEDVRLSARIHVSELALSANTHGKGSLRYA